MAKFVFRLQNVLNLKVRLEQQQRNNFAVAKKKLDEEEEKLEKLFLRLDDYEEHGRELLSAGLNVRDLLENENAIIRIKEYIEDQKAQVRLANMKLEEERVKLVEAMRERKTYEKLRENAYNSYIEEEKHDEGVINDEHNSFAYAAKEA